jgi:O-antigen/teichoic acid export membrane protein
LNFGKKVSLFLIPSIVQGFLGLIMVPVTTYVLEPEDFGLFALVSSMTALPSAMASMGSGYLLATHYPMLGRSERRAMISTFLLLGLCILLVFTGVALTVGPWLITHSNSAMTDQTAAITLSCLAMLFAYPWGISIDVITLDGNARAFAIVGVAQSIFSSIAIVMSLYILDLGRLSLFVGLLAGSVFQFFGALLVLRPYVTWSIDFKWGRQILGVGIPAAAATVLENVQTIIERYVLTAYAGFSQLGLYYHSQQYRGVVSVPVKAIARSVWPCTLVESKEPSRRFMDTKHAWDVAYVGVTFMGLLFATVGKPLIAWWTHDKFSDAYWIAAVWMVFVLIQNSGKPQTGILYAYGDAVHYSKISVLSCLITIVVLVAAGAVCGLAGVVGAILVQQVLLRTLVQFRARIHYRAPFQDQWVIVGSALIILTLGGAAYFDLQTGERILLFSFTMLILGIAAGSILSETLYKTLRWFRLADNVAN